MTDASAAVIVVGTLTGIDAPARIRIVKALAHSILVEFEEQPPTAQSTFEGFSVSSGDRVIELGKARYFPHPTTPHRRVGDPEPEPGHGRLVPVDSVFDFRGLIEKGAIVPLSQRVRQLPLILRRKDSVSSHFREYTSDVGYDLQVFRSVLDEIDRSLEHEPAAAAELVRAAAIAEQWEPFCELFDHRLIELERLVAPLGKQENEVHGFYFRKHMWDIILSSGFLARTNIKPRGYAGDSEMMRMVYEDRFFGPTIFSRFMHRHPIRTPAAQAVRNRRELLSTLIAAHADTRSSPVRLMSVACGPAWEIGDIVTNAQRAQRLSFTLLDQDTDALAEATGQLAAIEQRVGHPVAVRTIRDSVRTMLRTRDLRSAWGSFDFIYSMGLFDYLVGPVARAVLTKLYDLLEPGGELIIGNFHVSNPTRVYMEYWMDWVLFYRTEDEMLSLAADLPHAQASTFFEATGSQLFLRVTKGHG